MVLRRKLIIIAFIIKCGFFHGLITAAISTLYLSACKIGHALSFRVWLILRVSLRVSLLFVFCGLSSFALLLLFWFLLSSACVLFLALSFFFLCVLFLFLFLFSPFSSFCFSLVAIPLLLFFLSLRLVLQYRQLRFVLLSSVCLSLSLSLPRRAGLLFLESRPLVIVHLKSSPDPGATVSC